MRPDSYRSSSPDAWDIYTAEGGNAAINKTTVRDQAVGIVALIIACVTLGGFAMYVYSQQTQQALIDAKILAGAAKAEAVANASNTNSRVALDEVERMRTGLAAQKIVIPKGHD